jgi:hypothetical protein
VQILALLPNHPVQGIKEIQDIFYKFVWDGKPDNTKSNIIINNYEEEGLKLPHIQSFCEALKLCRSHKLIDPINISAWKILLLSYIEKYGGDRILYLQKEGLESISNKLNPFWRNFPLNLSEMLAIKDEEEKYIINIMSQPIWFKFNIKRNDKKKLLLKNIVIVVSFL